MIRLLIVDDEPMVRYGIRNSIAWRQHGIEVVGEAGNGRAAMQMAVRFHPDIVLCDIVMPVEDGIAFVHSLRQAMPEVRVIMITGYSSQSYMVEAIHSCVRDYLLKPASAEQILASVLKLKDEIERESVQMRERKNRDDMFVENLALLREHFTDDLLSGRLSPQRILENIRLLSLPLHGPRYAFVLTMCSSGDPWKLIQQCGTLLGAYAPLIARLPESSVVVSILNLSEPPDVRALCARAAECFGAQSGPSGAMVLSECVDAPEALASLYPTARQALDRGFWYGKGRVVPVAEIDLSPFPAEEMQSLEYKLFDAIQEGDASDIRNCAEYLINRLFALKPDRAALEELLERVEQTVNLFCRNANAPVLPRLESCGLDGLKSAFIDLCCQKKSSKRFGSGQVGRALRYIEHNSNANLSLESVAAQLYISPTYLSRILNEKTELGFYGWLHYFRIEKARDLLVHTDQKHYEIAQTVGYSSYKAFAEHFQSMTGCTASEYRQRFRKKP